MASYFVSPNAIMIEVLITPSNGFTAANTPFSEQQQLLNRPIVAIETFCSEDFIYSPISATIPVIPIVLFNACFLNVTRAEYIDGSGKAGLYYRNLPLCMLRRVKSDFTGANPSSSGVNELFRVRPMHFQWPDSNVAFPTPQGQQTTFSVPMLIHYLQEKEDPRPYMI